MTGLQDAGPLRIPYATTVGVPAPRRPDLLIPFRSWLEDRFKVGLRKWKNLKLVKRSLKESENYRWMAIFLLS